MRQTNRAHQAARSQRDLNLLRKATGIKNARLARNANPALLRAARTARLARLGPAALRALAAAGALALTPEVALAASAAAVAGGAVYLGKKLRDRKQRQGLIEAPPVEAFPNTPIVQKPAPSKPSPSIPVNVPKFPGTLPPMAPIKRNGGQGGRKKMWVPKYSPVSTITKAPVAIGNTIRGTQTIERTTKLGKLCHGRDFMFTPVAPGAVANWTMVGGCPLSPTAFADSSLRQYAQIYNKFRFLKFTAHFITSSPTSTNGDVMFYYAKNRESPFINQTSINLLPFVMSDPNAVIGPQWQNISAAFDVDSEWKSLDYGIDDSVKEYASGELFLLCKTSNTESPGYVIFDYEIEFGERSIQPRLLSLPITREIYHQAGVTLTGPTTINAPYLLRVGGNNISGVTSTWPVGITDGDIFKVIIDLTNSSLGANANFVTTSFYGHDTPTNTSSFAFSDGFTCYANYSSAQNGIILYLNSPAAYTGAANRQFWASNTGAVVMQLQFWFSYVGSTNSLLSNVSNF